MNINTSIRNTSIQPKPQAAAPSTQQAEDPLDQMDQAYERYNELRQDSEKFTPYRMGASILLGVAAAGAAGYFMGGATGIAGRVAGSLVGAAAGVTTGALAGSVAAEMSNAGSGALGYLGLGIMGGGAAGLAAGAFLGGDASPIIGAVAGAVGGVSVGFMGGQMLEDSIDKGLREKAGLPY